MKKYLNILLVLSIAGLLFSGYLSAIKLFTKVCALGESCPIFLGYPACWYGFAMYLLMFIFVVIAREVPSAFNKMMNATAVVALIGIFFSGRYVISEINVWMQNGDITPYALGLPTCAYGLIFYFLIFVVVVKAVTRK